jgi:hypothetical protein
MNIRDRVELSEAERLQPTSLLSGGNHAARKHRRAQILLAADAGISDDVIANSVSDGSSTVFWTRRRCVEGNLELALSDGHLSRIAGPTRGFGRSRIVAHVVRYLRCHQIDPAINCPVNLNLIS